MTSQGPILTRAAVREADRRAALLPGGSTMLLMENAGRGLADVTAFEAKSCGSTTLAVLGGGGNNGGDGFVAARHLLLRGWPVRILLAVPGESLRADTDPGRNLSFAKALGIPVVDASTKDALAAATAALPTGTLLVDALLGTGLRGPPRGFVKEVLGWLARSPLPVVAADIPSGLDADTGDTPGPVPACRATATFLALKPGLLRGRGPGLAGRITVCDIGVPLDALAPPGSEGRTEAVDGPG